METATLIFAGVTALSDGATAYNAYRANHPRRNRTGQIANYTAAHAGYSMAAPYRPVPQYNYLIQAPAYTVVNAPVYNVNYHQVMYTNPPIRSQSFNSAGPPPQQQQQVVPWQNARPAQPNRSASQGHIQPASFGGTITLLAKQSAPDTFEDDGFGLSTGQRSGYTEANAQTHWQSFRRSGYGGETRTVAVLIWTTGVSTMFAEKYRTCFRNYKVSRFNVAAFAQRYRRNEIFSGVVKNGELVGSKPNLTIVEDDGDCVLYFTNCWTELVYRDLG